MIDNVSKANRQAFSEREGVKYSDFLPNKYFEKYIRKDRQSKYDHPLMYRNKSYDFLFISNYWAGNSHFDAELKEEGFVEVPPMYNESCQTYMKKFKNTKTSVVKEASLYMF